MEQPKEIQLSEIARKFTDFRLAAEGKQKLCNEMQGVIQQLKEEIAFCRNIEKELRAELNDIQERILSQRQMMNDLNRIKKKNDIVYTQILALEDNLTNTTADLTQCKNSVKKLLETTTKELELLKERNELKETIKKKEADYDLLRMEMQTMKKENQIRLTEAIASKNDEVKEIVLQYESQISQMKEQLEEAKRENVDVKNHSERALIMYRKQLTECEQTIARYEKERSAILGELIQEENRSQASSTPKKKERNKTTEEKEMKNRIKWGDNTVSSFTGDSCSLKDQVLTAKNEKHITMPHDTYWAQKYNSPVNNKRSTVDSDNITKSPESSYEINSTQNEPITMDTGNSKPNQTDTNVSTGKSKSINSSQQLEQPRQNECLENNDGMRSGTTSKNNLCVNQFRPQNKKFQRIGFKQKMPQLEFSNNQEQVTQFTDGTQNVQIPKKRKLYSTNYNHYI